MSQKLEQMLIEGYQSMAEINLSIASEHYILECEVNDNHQTIAIDGE